MQVRSAGARIGLPSIAACADISSARPACDADGTPVGALFDFTSTGQDYWRHGDLALRNAIVAVIRQTAEPFYYDRGDFGGWRPLKMEPGVRELALSLHYCVRAAIVAPVHLPGSTIGAIVWATERDDMDVAALFDSHAAALHALALRFITSCDWAAHGAPVITTQSLTRREIQCLKLAAAGKTDGEIGSILSLAVPTVRFHMKKASSKLGETGRLRTVQRAADLGYVATRH